MQATTSVIHTRKASGVRSEGSRYRPSKNICLLVVSRHILWHDRALGPPCQCVHNTQAFTGTTLPMCAQHTHTSIHWDHPANVCTTHSLSMDSYLCTTCCYLNHMFTYTHTRLTALCPGLPRWAGTRKVKPMWILLKQQTVSGSGISWAICKSAPRSSQETMPVPHHSVYNHYVLKSI